MKVVFINGDAKKDSKILKSHQLIIEVLAQEEIETEIINLSERTVLRCCGCYACMSKQLSQCSMNDDYFNECFAKMVAADGIILGSPPISSGVTSQIKAFLVRASLVLSANHILLRHRVGSVIFSSRTGS